MNLYNVSDEQLALIAAGIVAAIRKKYPQINGLLYVSIATFVVAFAMCSVVVVGQGSGVPTISSIIHGIVRTIWIAVQSIAGVSMISYFADKALTRSSLCATNGKDGEKNDSSPEGK